MILSVTRSTFQVGDGERTSCNIGDISIIWLWKTKAGAAVHCLTEKGLLLINDTCPVTSKDYVVYYAISVQQSRRASISKQVDLRPSSGHVAAASYQRRYLHSRNMAMQLS